MKEREREIVVEIGDEWVDVTVVYQVSGSHRPAVIRMDPDDSYPAEEPEVDIISLTRSDTGEAISEKLVWPTDRARWDFEDAAIMEAAEDTAAAKDAYDADAYDRYYDR